jgi:hypothetical protein
MTLRTILSAGLASALVLLPVTALADLQVNASGFARIVASSTQGDSCEVQQSPGGTAATCPNGSRGTIVLYRERGAPPVCELDFWYAGNGSGMERWRAQLSHQNTDRGGCVMHWDGSNALTVSAE